MDSSDYSLLVLFLCSVNLAATAGLMLYVRRKSQIFYRQLDRLDRIGQTEAWNATSILSLLDNKVPLPAPGGWAASTDLLAEIMRHILQRKPNVVVELGSGLSSVVIALTLKMLGRGKLWSIDHDTAYASATRENLALNDADSYAAVRVAPLVRTGQFGTAQTWYDISLLDDLWEIDLLIVDGPPAIDDPLRRYPSLPFFWDRLRVGGMIILDDTNRPGERAIIDRWIKAYPDALCTWLPLERGAAVITKQTA